ncbi:MAG: TOBE domain-containing protein [Proteobacteria bacterium]|nr:TOBE domain-containing protein [Pseudomonadota bacterium]MBU4297580.1 TOBE domain-containing protein [Pseudomonadota bacterium]MCG2748846.1 TOBE domain-containing protein [Desulfobulbaceae bacterium]
MKDRNDPVADLLKQFEADSSRGRFNPAGIFSVPKEVKCLDTAQLTELENAFRQWVDDSARSDVRASRRRILLIFLLIRYSGGRLNEILTLNEQRDLDWENDRIRLGGTENGESGGGREVQIPAQVCKELKAFMDDAAPGSPGTLFQVDPAHVRRKFYEQAKACGLPADLANPNAIRRSRAIELLRSNVPLPIVQKLLGHSTANLTAAYVDFSDKDMRPVIQHFLDKESRRKTSARNTFFGKITRIKKGDIQSSVELVTLGGDTLQTIITNDSLKRLGLKTDSFITAEVKAPWVIIARESAQPMCSAENRFLGTVSRIIRGTITTEFVVRIADGTELCTIVSRESDRSLGIRENDRVWVFFNAYAVILNIE